MSNIKRRKNQYRILMQALIILCFVIAVSFVLLINLFGKSDKNSSYTSVFSESSNDVGTNEIILDAQASTENKQNDDFQNDDFQNNDWYLILVNRDHPLPDNYTRPLGRGLAA